MNETFICSHCRQEYPAIDRFVFDGQELCQSCYETKTCICDHCGERIWAEDDCGDSDLTLCHDCADRYYERCSNCGRLVEIDRLHYLDVDDLDSYCGAATRCCA